MGLIPPELVDQMIGKNLDIRLYSGTLVQRFVLAVKVIYLD
jgi:hypothetical protein